MSPSHLVVLAIAGGAGCALRVLARDALMRRGTHPWWSTCIVNLSGACAVGLLAGLLSTRGADSMRGAALAATGFLGGWTTFSAFSMDVVQLWLRGSRVHAAVLWAATMLGTPLVALAAAVVGRSVTGGPR
jgi:CrcB protein